MKNGVKMIDIAHELGVSVVTVSNALAGRDGVSSQLRQKICETARNMGYKPSNTRNSRKSSYSIKPGKSVGILTSEKFVGYRGTFYWELTAGISNRLSELNIYTVFESVSVSNERDSVLPKMITENKIDGIMVIGQIKRNYIELLSKIKLPVVFVDFYDSRFDIDSVNSDSYQGGYLLTDYLIRNGHRNIGFLGTITATSSIYDRFLGYIKCLIENNIPYHREWTLNDRDEGGVIYSKIDLPNDMPTAFVCNCDETAFRVINSLKSKGLRVPEDISVVGYDNYTVSSICIPPITTIEVNIEKMAETAVEIIARKLENPDYLAGRRIITGKLIEKKSVLDIRGLYGDFSAQETI